jgi:hypothetical protein
MSPPNASVPSPDMLLPSATAPHIRREHDSAEAWSDIPRPSSVSLEVRRTCWDRLWQILLREPANDDVEQQGAEPSSESAETNDAAARAVVGREMAMSE